jgi:hypothetical protein
MVQRTNQLLNVTGLAGAAAGNGTALQVPRSEGENFVSASVDITGTLTIVIQGRVDSLSQWLTLQTYTADGGDLIAWYPQMRATYSGASAGAAGLAQIDRYCKVAT